jgi:hypothetical protein
LARALYLRDDPFEKSDAVFGVKESLIINLKSVSDIVGLAEKYDVAPSTKLLSYDFVLLTDEESRKLRNVKATEAMEKQDASNLRVVDGILIPKE